MRTDIDNIRVGDKILSMDGLKSYAGIVMCKHEKYICVKRNDGESGGGCHEEIQRYWRLSQRDCLYLVIAPRIPELNDKVREGKGSLEDTLIDFGRLKTFYI